MTIGQHLDAQIGLKVESRQFKFLKNQLLREDDAKLC